MKLIAAFIITSILMLAGASMLQAARFIQSLPPSDIELRQQTLALQEAEYLSRLTKSKDPSAEIRLKLFSALAMIYWQQGKWTEAAASLHDAIQHSPLPEGKAVLLESLAAVFRDAQSFQASKQALEQASKLYASTGRQKSVMRTKQNMRLLPRLVDIVH